MLRRYLSPEKNNATQPTLQVHILCGDGRLFTAFRQELYLKQFLEEPIPRFLPAIQVGHNSLKHGNMYLFHSTGSSHIQLAETFTLTSARDIRDEFKIPTDSALRIPSREMIHWLRSPSGPCTLSYYMQHKNQLIMVVSQPSSMYHNHLARLIAQEWHPYLAGERAVCFALLDEQKMLLGMFIYACRLQLTFSSETTTCARRAEAHATANNETLAECVEQAARGGGGGGGPAGDC